MKEHSLKTAATAVIIFAMITGTAGAAEATTTKVGGGTWFHDADNARNYSNYLHPSKKHRSSVQNRYGLVRSGDRSGGRWSYASQGVALYGNVAFWHVY